MLTESELLEPKRGALLEVEIRPVLEYVALEVALVFERKYVGFASKEGEPSGVPQYCDWT